MYQMKITGTFGLRIEGPKDPVTYELMFDHVQVDVEGVEPHVIADALVVAFHRAMVPSERAIIDSLEQTFYVVNDEDTARNKAWMLALIEAEQLMTDSETTGYVGQAEDLRGKAARVLATAGLRPSLTYREVRRAAQLLHVNGELSDAFLAAGPEVSK